MKNIALLELAGLLVSTSAFAQADTKLVWGGGDAKSSTYTGVYVPHVIDILAQNRLSGYRWAGLSEGTLFNAQKITENPTNLAVGQLDLLNDLVGKPIPGTSKTYSFTFLAKDIGPECLYMVTKQPGYATMGDVVGNAFDMTIATGKEGSGSLGTLQLLQQLYPDLEAANIEQVGGAAAIVDKVIKDPATTHGFFVQRPDPASEVFKAIADNGLTIIPLVDFELENLYSFQELKVSYGGLFGADKFVTTACTSVALITGDSANIPATDTRSQKLLSATIDRISKIDPQTLKPNLSTWMDMWGSMKSVAGSKAQEMMEASKKALEDAAKGI